MEAIFSPVGPHDLSSKNSASGEMMLLLINFKGWEHIEFVIKEAVKRGPNKSPRFQIFLSLNMGPSKPFPSYPREYKPPSKAC